MPVPTPPFTYHCPQCGWSKTVVPKSDVMVRGHTWFETCPECNHAPQEQSSATMVELTIAKLKDVIRK